MLKTTLFAAALALIPSVSFATEADDCRRLTRLINPGESASIAIARPAALLRAGRHQGLGAGHYWVWYEVWTKAGGFLCGRNAFGEYVFVNLETGAETLLR